MGPETSHPYIHPRDAPSTTHLDPHRHDSPKIFTPQNSHSKADFRGWGSPARRFHRTPGVHSTAMSVTTDRKKISGLSYDPSHEGRGASCACAYLVPSPRPFADRQNLQTSASRDTSSDRFRANFPRRCPVNTGFLGSGPKFVAFRTLYERVFAIDCLGDV